MTPPYVTPTHTIRGAPPPSPTIPSPSLPRLSSFPACSPGSDVHKTVFLQRSLSSSFICSLISFNKFY